MRSRHRTDMCALPVQGARVEPRSFPDGFVWGAATASYQIEGAAREDGRGESIWDRFSHTPGRVRNGDTGDVACDHYHRYRDDVALMAGLGFNAYRCSVSWSRVLPAGTGTVNQAGLDFYDRLVDELLAHQIAPFVTLYHWDLPQALEDAGGWAVRAAAPATLAGIVLNLGPQLPASSHPLDLEAACAEHDWLNRWFLDPLVGRAYPEPPRWAAGVARGEVRDGDMERIAAPFDFLGVNYYSRNRVRSPLLPQLEPAGDPPERTGMGWEIYPAGLAEVLEFVSSRTGALPLYITENGAAYPVDDSEPARDPARVSFLRRHLDAALDALERGVPLRGYFVWSLLDNFEWAQGYGPRFGIVHVDYQTLERRVRDSARFMGAVAH